MELHFVQHGRCLRTREDGYAVMGAGYASMEPARWAGVGCAARGLLSWIAKSSHSNSPIQILRPTVKIEKSGIPELAMPLQPKSDLEKDPFCVLQIIVLERGPP